MKVNSLSRVQTLSDPMDCSLPGSSIHGILQARALERGAIAFSEDRILGAWQIQHVIEQGTHMGQGRGVKLEK